jgi:hypothetical protein
MSPGDATAIVLAAGMGWRLPVARLPGHVETAGQGIGLSGNGTGGLKYNSAGVRRVRRGMADSFAAWGFQGRFSSEKRVVSIFSHRENH